MSYLVNPFRFGSGPTYDADAQDYFDRVEAVSTIQADAKAVVNAFVLALKAGNNYWERFAHINIFCAADTLAGALVCLKGSIDALSFNIDSGDYDRKTGIIGNTTNKYINTRRAINAENRYNAGYCCYITQASTQTSPFIFGGGGGTGAVSMQNGSSKAMASQMHNGGATTGGPAAGNYTGAFILSRPSAAAQYSLRANQTQYTVSSGAGASSARQVFVLAKGNSTSNDTTPTGFFNGRALLYFAGQAFCQSPYSCEEFENLCDDFSDALAALA